MSHLTSRQLVETVEISIELESSLSGPIARMYLIVI